MTDQTITAPMLDPPAGNRRRLVLVALGAIVALAGLYVVVVGPLLITDPTALGLPPDAQGADALVAPEDPDVGDEITGAEAAPLPLTSKVFAARDPFQQLVTLAAPGVVAAGGTTVTEAITGSTTTTTASAVPAGTGTGATQTTGLPATRVENAVVKLIQITRRDGVEQAIVTVDGVQHTAAEGEQFAASFRVLDITGDCATLASGERRFTLCAGEEIRK